MAKFEDYETRGPRGQCPRCGEEANAGAVSVRLSKFQEGSGNSSHYRQVASRHISMCEACCTEVFEGLVETLTEQAGGGTRAPRSVPTRRTPATDEVTPRRRARRARSAERR